MSFDIVGRLIVDKVSEKKDIVALTGLTGNMGVVTFACRGNKGGQFGNERVLGSFANKISC